MDAGTSTLAAPGDAIALAARVAGGVAPYAYSWSLGGDASRFADASAASTTLDTTGLSGDVVVTLGVTDASGATATDTVRHHVSGAPTVLTVGGPVLVGLPDEVVGESVDALHHTFIVQPGAPFLAVVLDWTNGVNDLDFKLFAPDGSMVGGNAASTGAKPERIDVSAPAAGTWSVRVEPFASVPDSYALEVTLGAGAPMPFVDPYSPYEFGVNDSQHLYAAAFHGTPPYAYAWDLDGDGVPETQGRRPFASFPVGTHGLVARVTDARGFETETPGVVVVEDVDRILRLSCGEDVLRPFRPMEFNASNGSCWMHGGHHTYFFGDDAFRLLSGSGWVYSVEQQYSPPSEVGVGGGALLSPIHVETSMDGQAWTEIGVARYVLASPTNLLPTRQVVQVELDATDDPFRYLRVTQPRSAAQGLSGFLDESRLSLRAERVAPAAAPTPLAPATRALDCAAGDHLEDFFADHPCWFGGVNRYDAASFFHTYPLGDADARLTRVQGEFTLVPWRTDDWFQGEPIVPNATATHAFVQVSVDGGVWKDVAVVNATFGVAQAFSVNLTDEPARFVRLLPADHARSEGYRQDPSLAPNHHREGQFVDSRLVVEGRLPPA